MPILIASTRPPTPFLYDPSGEPVDLVLATQGGALDSCAIEYYVYYPRFNYATGEFALLLADDLSPHTSTTFELERSNPGAFSVDATVDVLRESFDPVVADSASCSVPPLNGSTIVGGISGSVSLSPAAAVFVEAWFDEPNVGRIHELRSTIAIPTDVTAPRITTVTQFHLPLTEQSDGCFHVRLYDWTLESVWNQEICLGVGESESLSVTFNAREANLSPSALVPPEDPRHTESGCSVGILPHTSFPSGFPISATLLVLIGLSRRGRMVPPGRT